jgi:uncharacterized repeat protein (TIGR04076 family)
MYDDEYELYDLKVEVVASDDGKPMVCQHHLGDYFTVTDDDLIEFPPGVRFPMYSLATILPLLAAKQRETSKYDWMTTDAVLACADPNCGGRFLITRGEKKVYRHSEQTATETPT